MRDILYSEWLKLKRSKVVVIGFLGTLIVPMLVLVNSIQRYLRNPNQTITLYGLYDGAVMFLMLLFAPLVMSVIATYLISREYTEKTLKTIFTVPVSKKQFLEGKFLILFMMVMLFMLISWLDILILAVICSFFLKVEQITAVTAVPFLLEMLFGGILLYMTLMPIVYLSIRNKGFIAPFIVVAVICLLNVVLSNTGIAGFLPWTASYLLVSRGRSGNFGCPPFVSFLIIAAVCVLSVIASRKRFMEEDIG